MKAALACGRGVTETLNSVGVLYVNSSVFRPNARRQSHNVPEDGVVELDMRLNNVALLVYGLLDVKRSEHGSNQEPDRGFTEMRARAASATETEDELARITLLRAVRAVTLLNEPLGIECVGIRVQPLITDDVPDVGENLRKYISRLHQMTSNSSPYNGALGEMHALVLIVVKQ